jgi:hypothetical protein
MGTATDYSNPSSEMLNGGTPAFATEESRHFVALAYVNAV